MLTISNMYWFIPACETQFRNVGSCILGEQEASTTWSSFSSTTSSRISFWPGSEHMYL